MKHETQVRLIREALDALERGSPPMAESWTENLASVYTSPERAERERKALFHDHPIVAGFSSALPEPGDYLTDDLSLVPLLLVRQASGVLKAFVNACRHRGSKLVSGGGRCSSLFTCPYHAWSYDLNGHLRAIPDDFGFAGLDRDGHGLIELPVDERYGLIWVLPRPGGSFAVSERLGGLADELEDYRIEECVLVQRRVLEKRMNWKLVSDTFWEAYHLKPLHKKTIAPIFVRNLGLFEAFGRNHRFVGVRASIAKLRELPEREWDLLPHATILMNLFPNTILVMQSDHVEAYRIFPDPERSNRCRLEIDILAPRNRLDVDWRRIMDLLVGVVEEDFAIGEGIQRNFDCGAVDHVVYGRFEQALEHFHRSVREAVGGEE